MATPLAIPVQRRRARPRRTIQRHPDQLHIFTYRLEPGGLHPRFATVLVRGRMGQVAAMDPATAQAWRLGHAPMCVDINTVPPPRPTPKLDALCARHSGFRTFLELLTATAGYRPSIRLDLAGRDGLVLARAYDRQQQAWGDPRRACVSGALPARLQAGGRGASHTRQEGRWRLGASFSQLP